MKGGGASRGFRVPHTFYEKMTNIRYGQHKILETIPVEAKRLLSHNDNQFLSHSFASLYLSNVWTSPKSRKIISTRYFIRISFYVFSASGVPHWLKGLERCCSGSTTRRWAAYLVIVVTIIDKYCTSCILSIPLSTRWSTDRSTESQKYRKSKRRNDK